MNSRERYIEVLKFGTPDRIPFKPGMGRESTLARWHKEGLPESINTPSEVDKYVYEQIGGTLPFPETGPGFDVKERMMPQFEEKLIEKKERSQIVQDWKGNICEISNEFDVRYLREALDFVTRRWIKCPVESRKDWEQMKLRYDPANPDRLPKNADELGRKLKDRDYPLELILSGPFWQLREWLGFENLCMAFHDDPSLIKDMIEFWTDYMAKLLKRFLASFVPDSICIGEDMAYKGFSMISPAMCREFIMPCWKKWSEIIHDAGVPIFVIDSDGFIGELIPLWIESGVDACAPMEVAAGNDVNEYRKKFGKNIAFRDGVDKRAIATGGKTIEDEIKRLKPVIQNGGYIPSCDHGVPHDISWQNFMHYSKLLAKETGWL